MVLENIKESRELRIQFDGPQIVKGVVDAEDFSETVNALAKTIQAIHEVGGIRDHRVKVEIVALDRGSFEADLVITLRTIGEVAIASLPLISLPGTLEIVKGYVDVLKAVIRIRKFLGGEKPQQVVINQEGDEPSATVFNFMGQNTTINLPTYNVLQNGKVNKNIQKLVKPLIREGGEVEEIKLEDVAQNEMVGINKTEAEFFVKAEELQSTPDYRLKGIVSALDRKTGSGRLTVGEKRINFEILLEPAELLKLDNIFLILIDSMKFKIPIILKGEAVLDFEGNIKKFTIRAVEGERKLIN